ncbi:intermembrane phospholipid transport protein YdbH family protein [Kangiella sediminilitoris]|uniref:intermembrane phospholipid transport protein YdbH family protein n=1 Tax=Kangiella sediminilitoris TaxID=1144748 RepID=UPI00083E5F7C|nr:YdbH domain-containing protein [Kangiella sediminilitoris]
MSKKVLLKKIAKVLLWILCILVILFAIAYWTAPSWVPSQVKRFLPPSIELQQLELKHPGLSSTEIDHLVLQLGEKQQYRLKLEQVTLGYSLWQRKLTSITAQNALFSVSQSKDSPAQSKPLSSIALPHIPVAEMRLNQLLIEGLTPQPILSKAIVIRDSGSSISLNSQVEYLKKQFQLNVDAKRNEAALSRPALSGLSLTVSHQQDKIHLEATPITSQKWSLQGDGLVAPETLYPQPGIGPVSFKLNATADWSQTPFTFIINSDSNLQSTINSHHFSLNDLATGFLQQYKLKTNIDQFESDIAVSAMTDSEVVVSYAPSTSLLTIKQGQIALSLTTPEYNLDAVLKSLVYDLSKNPTDKSQQLLLDTKLGLRDLQVNFDSPKHKINSRINTLQLESKVSIKDSVLNLSTAKGKLGLDTVSYQGDNSHGKLIAGDWSLAGSSVINFNQAKDNTHQWQVKNIKPVNGKLTLNDEEISAENLATTLQMSLSEEQPKGAIQGQYTLEKLSFKKQPLTLNQLKGSLKYLLSETPSGQLTFDNAKYNGQQIGVSDISGKLDWTKQPSNLVAAGTIKHQQSTVPFRYSFNLKSSQHNLKVKQSSLPISSISRWLTILKNYPQLSFNSGQLEINSLDGDPLGLLFNGKLNVDNLNLNYDEFYIKNWTVEDTLTPNSKLGGTLKSHIEQIELATDISVTNITFLMPHTIDSLVVTDLKGSLLKGNIDIPRLAVNKDGIEPFTVNLKAVDIGALLKALNSEKLNIKGLFDFTLPLKISEQGQQIVDGKFAAVSEGVIHIKSEQGKDANIAFQALENFQYKSFSGTLNYNNQGHYVIELNVLGSNPDLYNGFPIKLDLTLRGELPNLIYAMLVSGDMTKPILDDLEQKQMLNIQQ